MQKSTMTSSPKCASSRSRSISVCDRVMVSSGLSSRSLFQMPRYASPEEKGRLVSTISFRIGCQSQGDHSITLRSERNSFR